MKPSDPGSRLDEAIGNAALRILNALARVLLRHGVSFHAFSELAKQAYVDVARRDFALPGRKASISRVSVLTGLTRKDVQRLLSPSSPPEQLASDNHNRAARVVAGWVRDKELNGGDGSLPALPFEGSVSFSEVVRRYSGDVPPRAGLDELERVGPVSQDAEGRIRLLSRVYIPRHGDLGKLAILGSDVSFLIETIDHNIQETATPRFQRKVMYDNLPMAAVDELRPLAARQAQELIEALDAWMAQRDRDANPQASGDGRFRAGLGVFYFEHDLDAENGAGK